MWTAIYVRTYVDFIQQSWFRSIFSTYVRSSIWTILVFCPSNFANNDWFTINKISLLTCHQQPCQQRAIVYCEKFADIVNNQEYKLLLDLRTLIGWVYWWSALRGLFPKKKELVMIYWALNRCLTYPDTKTNCWYKIALNCVSINDKWLR